MSATTFRAIIFLYLVLTILVSLFMLAFMYIVLYLLIIKGIKVRSLYLDERAKNNFGFGPFFGLF